MQKRRQVLLPAAASGEAKAAQPVAVSRRPAKPAAEALFASAELDEMLADIALRDEVGEAQPLEEVIRTSPRRRGRVAMGVPDSADIYPLDAPGMPLPGPDIWALAQALGDETQLTGKKKDVRLEHVDNVLADLYRSVLYSAGTVHLPITLKGNQQKRLSVVTGHIWGAEEVRGPVRADVMVIGKNLGFDEKTSGRNFVGPTGQLLAETCQSLGLDSYHTWYVTNLLKTEHPNAATGGSTLSRSWVKEWLPVLHQELRLVQPKYILCLGADAVSALLDGANRPALVRALGSDGREAFPGNRKASIKGMEGRVVEYTYPISREFGADGKLVYHTALVMAITHPAAVLRAPEQTEIFENGLGRFGQLIAGNRPDQEEQNLDHREIDNLEDLQAWYHEVQATCEHNLLAVDAEWHGDHPQNDGAYLRTIQFSWREKAAVCIHLRHPGGKWRFKGGRKALLFWLRKLVQGRRVAGHFFSADLEWLVHFGLDLRKQFAVADNWLSCMQQARQAKPRGGIDTGLAAHALNETGDFGLTSLSLRHTSAPRYDVHLNKWRDEYCSKHKLKKEDLEGYGECPDDILVPYACYDADVTWRLAVKLTKLLYKDGYGNNCWEPFWMSMRAQPAALEINCTGLEIDRDRLDELVKVYLASRTKLEQRIRKWARWPDLNLNSVFQVREFLFGEELNGKEREHEDSPPIRLRPPEARTLRLLPVLTTDKRPMRWDEVLDKNLEREKTPSTNKQALSLLAQDNQEVVRFNPKTRKRVAYNLSEQVTWIRDYRFISQVLKSTLRSPVKIDEDDADSEYVLTVDGYYVYAGGLPASICDDNRVRTHMYQTKETGRWSSARPPLQNLSKRREADYRRILGKDYRWPIRTVIRAPAGYVLVEADYSGAELYGMAIMSGDERMIADYESGADIHSQVAVLAFRLPCEPTKVGLRSVPNPKNPSDPEGCEFLRIVAKAVIFGIAYGRGAKAIALSAKEEGVDITVEEAQRVIDTLFELYPGLVPFFEECRSRAVKERWLCGCFGRFRRFQTARDRMTIGDFERQAMNFPIQGMIADAMNRALDHLYYYRDEHPELTYKIALQIHDAVLLLVPYAQVPRVIDEVLPRCMVDRVPIYPTALDGRPNGTGPYSLAVEVEPYLHWGEVMWPDQHLRIGLDVKYSHWKPVAGGYVHKNYPKQIWVGDASGGSLTALSA